MAPSKNSRTKKAQKFIGPKQINFQSPTWIHRMKLNENSHKKLGRNLMLTMDLEAKPKPLTASDQAQLDRFKTVIVHPFEDIAVRRRLELRQKKGLTALSQTEWERLTKPDVVKSVIESRPLAIAGPLLKKGTPFEREEFYKTILSNDKRIHKEASQARTAAKKSKKGKKAMKD